MANLHFAGIELTDETILATREWFAENSRLCIEDARTGRTRVNDLPGYIEWEEQRAAASLAGEYDHTFTFLQRAHTMQTGECIPLLA